MVPCLLSDRVQGTKHGSGSIIAQPQILGCWHVRIRWSRPLGVDSSAILEVLAYSQGRHFRTRARGRCRPLEPLSGRYLVGRGSPRIDRQPGIAFSVYVCPVQRFAIRTPWPPNEISHAPVLVSPPPGTFKVGKRSARIASLSLSPLSSSRLTSDKLSEMTIGSILTSAHRDGAALFGLEL